MRTIIVAALLLTSCGAVEASPSGKPSPMPDTVAPTTTSPTTERASPTTTSLTTIASPTTTSPAPSIVDAEAAFPPRLALTTRNGQIVTFSPHEDPIVTPGVMAPTGQVVVSASFMAGRTMVEWHDVRTDEIFSAVQIDGDFHPTAVAQDGKLVALIG